MSYPALQEAQLIRRAFTSILDFRGRSRRYELIMYQIAVALIGVVFGFLILTPLDAHTASASRLASNLLVSIPLFALFVRRLHDLNQSGWWSLLLPVGIMLTLIEQYRFQTGISAIPDLPSPWVWAKLPIALALLAITLAPGTKGPNRYGDDPRDD